MTNLTRVQLLASRAFWRRREMYRYRKSLAAKSPSSYRKWRDLYKQARQIRRRRDVQLGRVSERCISLIAKWEGYRANPYRNFPGEPWTIGYGHTHGVTKHTGPWTEPYARKMLRKTVAKFARDVVRQLKRTPTQNEFDAMVSLAYNIGIGGFMSSSVLRHFNAGRKKEAANAFLMWNKVNGKPVQGLTNRRREERSLFLR